MSYTVKLIMGLIGTALFLIFIGGLSQSISTGFAGFYGGLAVHDHRDRRLCMAALWISGTNACARNERSRASGSPAACPTRRWHARRATMTWSINHDDTPGTAEQIIAASAEFDAIIPCHSEHFSADVVAQFDDRLKIVANHSVGVDHCDLPALKARGIAVTNTPDVLSDATAELAMLLMLGAARHAVAGDRIVRTGAWDSWSPAFMVGKQVTGARLGIIGMGRVGRAFAAKARGFDMDIHYCNRTRLAGSIRRKVRPITTASKACLGSRISCRCTAPPHPRRPI